MPPVASAVPPVVSPQWLAERLGRPEVKVLDASWYMPAMGEQPAAINGGPAAHGRKSGAARAPWPLRERARPPACPPQAARLPHALAAGA